MVYKQIILICLLWNGVQSCERNETETSATSEGSRRKRSCLDTIGKVQHCEGTLEFIPSITRRPFKKRPGVPSRTKPLRRNKLKADYATITGNCCFKLTDSEGNCDIIRPSGSKTPEVKIINKIILNSSSKK